MIRRSRRIKPSYARNSSASAARACNTAIYLFKGEPHECERVIRYMERVARGIPGDIRLFPMEESTWDAQIVITECIESTRRVAELGEFVKVW